MQNKEVEIPYTGERQSNESCKAVIRPETIKIGKEGLLEGKVKSSTFMGSYQDYIIEGESFTIQIHDINPKIKTIYSEGETVGVDFSPENIHIV